MRAIMLPSMTRYLILLVLLGAGCSPALWAQDLQFEHFTKADGLPTDYYYNTIVQDRQGFLWLGSSGGLIRYDGYQFETFRHDPLDSTSISNDVINALYEDLDGMLWVGTDQGLNRFDPKAETFTCYRHDPDNPASLSSDKVFAILQTRDGTLWVGTNRGLNRLDGPSEIDNSPVAVFTRFLHNPDDERSLSDDWINALYEDRDSRLWVGTGDTGVGRGNTSELQAQGGGLNRYDPKGLDGRSGIANNPADGFTRFLPVASASSLDNAVTAIGEDGKGTLYVGTCHSVLYRYDRVGERLEPLLTDPNDPNRLHAPPGEASKLWCSQVSVIYEDREEMLWIGIAGGGLNRYDAATDSLTQFRHDPKDPTSLSGDNVLTFYEDRQGGRWIGTFDKGFNKAVTSFNRFRLYAGDEIRANNGVFSLHEDEKGLLWIGTHAGQLFRFNPATEVLERFSRRRPFSDGLWGNGISGVLKDQDGMLWVSQEGGVYKIDPIQKTHTALHYDPADPNIQSLSETYVMAIEEDAQGSVWIGTVGGGIYRYDQHTGQFTHFLHDPTDEKSPSGNSTASIYQDRQGVHWFGLFFGDGMNRFDDETETFTTYLDGESIDHFYEDRAGRFWVASSTNGLYLWDRAAGQALQHYTTEAGLPNNAISSIVEDSLGLLWLTTPSGLARFNPDTEIFTIYNEDDGLDNYTAVRKLALLNRDGMLFIGGLNGLTMIDPEAFTPNPFPPTSVITRLRVFEEDHALTGSQEAPIKLAHDENELTFSYVGLHFANPSRNRYAYRLDGYDTDWRQAGTVRTATYTNLGPGTYTFRVKASNSDGVWDEEGTSLAVTIRPPWWKTWWAYALYGLLFVTGVFAIDRFQRRRLITRERQRAEVAQERLRAEAAERELEQAREIEKAHTELQEAHTELGQAHEHLKATQTQLIQQEKMASLGALTAGIAHEIKNPLNFVNNFADLNEELLDEVEEELAENPNLRVSDIAETLSMMKLNASKIREQGQRADGIVHAMMQHASGGTGERAATDVNALVEEYVGLAYHGKRAQVPDFNVEIVRELGEEVGSVALVPQDIGRVLLNLCGNAFDAMHEKAVSVNGVYEPVVTISTRRKGNTVEISVSDNGPGVPAAVREKIFEPFFTTKPTGSGTGLGLSLSLSYDIVTQGHGGTLAVEGKEGEGATFVVTLPR